MRDTAGQVHVGLVNADPNRAMPVNLSLTGVQATSASGRIITGTTMDAHNSFDQPNTVSPQPFTGAQVAGGVLSLSLPPKSVVVLDLR